MTQFRGHIGVQVTFEPPGGPFEGPPPEQAEVARQVMISVASRIQERVATLLRGSVVRTRILDIDPAVRLEEGQDLYERAHGLETIPWPELEPAWRVKWARAERAVAIER